MNEEKNAGRPNKFVALIVISVIFLGVASFYGGITYQKSKQPSFPGRQIQTMNGQNGDRRAAGMRSVSGEIVNIEDNTVTIKTADGGSKIVVLSGQTKFNKTSDASKSDLKSGASIMVIGAEGSDRTITAQMITMGENLVREINRREE